MPGDHSKTKLILSPLSREGFVISDPVLVSMERVVKFHGYVMVKFEKSSVFKRDQKMSTAGHENQSNPHIIRMKG